MSKIKFGSKNVNENLRDYLKKQESILALVVFEMLSDKIKPSGKQWKIVFPLLHSLLDSCDSLLLLSESRDPKLPKVRSSFVVSRTILEIIINILFILAKKDVAADRAHNHWLQKTFRDLERELKIGEQVLKLKWDGEVDLEIYPEIKKALEEFTSNRGKEVNQWTPESLVERLEVIQEKFGSKISNPLQFGVFGIYRHASEISHGTFFSALWILGTSEPGRGPKNAAGMEENMRGHLSFVLFLTFLSITSLFYGLGKELPKEDLIEVSKKLEKSLLEEKWGEDMRKA
jgi:hypothetical protein